MLWQRLSWVSETDIEKMLQDQSSAVALTVGDSWTSMVSDLKDHVLMPYCLGLLTLQFVFSLLGEVRERDLLGGTFTSSASDWSVSEALSMIFSVTGKHSTKSIGQLVIWRTCTIHEMKWCFRPWFCIVKAILGQGQPGLMKWILLWIMLDLLTSSPACYHCTMDASSHAQYTPNINDMLVLHYSQMRWNEMKWLF